jgi:RND family efflux transporter MFP subunit
MPHKSSKLKMLLILPPLIIGFATIIVMKNNRQAPTVIDSGEPVRLVRTLTLEASDFTPLARGYGEVRPAQVWQAVAQVAGRIVETHPRLNNGEIIRQGETLLRIDPVDYELNLAQARIQLAELDLQESNTRASLQIEQRNLALAEKEFNRLADLASKGTVSQSSADAAERTMLQSSAQVQNLKNSLSLIPSQKNLQRAKITQTERDLENTLIRAPFNLRISGMAVEDGQYVGKGQSMFSGDAVDRVEITAQVAMSSLKNLFSQGMSIPADLHSLSTDMSLITGFKPSIKLDMGDGLYAHWDAEFVRFADAIDSKTRTMGVVVAVDKPLAQIVPGRKPPLSKGMFVEVEIAGKAQPGTILAPRTALRNGHAYIMNSENRLEIRAIKRRFDQQSMSVIGEGLQAGERLVLTDLVPAVQGMLLKSTRADGE